jgi:hypothetical protein
MRAALFWVVTLRVVAIFLPTFRNNLSVLSSPLKMGPRGCPETSAGNWLPTRCVITQKSAVFIQAVCVHNYITAVDFFDLEGGRLLVTVVLLVSSDVAVQYV